MIRIYHYSSCEDDCLSDIEFNRMFDFERMQNNLERSWIADCDEDYLSCSIAYGQHRKIPSIILDNFPEIELLDISHNKISNLDTLYNFGYLKSLIADHNLISEKTIIPMMPSLELLWLNRCQISWLHPWVISLQTSCPDIKYLSLMDNPGTPSYFNGATYFEYLQYRLYVISLFPKLVHLDDRAVTVYERSECQRLYKRPFLEKFNIFERESFTSLPKCLVQRKWHKNPSLKTGGIRKFFLMNNAENQVI